MVSTFADIDNISNLKIFTGVLMDAGIHIYDIWLRFSWLGLKPPPPGSQWLDGRYDGCDIKNLQAYLLKHVDKDILPEEQEKFAAELKGLFQKAYGRSSNDRNDRTWGSTAIRRRLEKLNWGYTFTIENSIWILKRTESASIEQSSA